jgi:hypothetical protein
MKALYIQLYQKRSISASHAKLHINPYLGQIEDVTSFFWMHFCIEWFLKIKAGIDSSDALNSESPN